MFDVKWSNGEALTAENKKDARMEIAFMEAPKLALSLDTLQLDIPKIRAKYMVKSISGEEITIIHFLARLRVDAKIGMEQGVLTINFEKNPIADFQMIERNGVAKGFSDQEIHQMLNGDIAKFLSSFNMSLPLISGRSANVKFIGINEVGEKNAQRVDRALSLYLDITKD